MSERVGVYVCHCGVNISATVDVERVREFAAGQPDVAVARDYRFMCSDPGQEMIRYDIQEHGLTRVVVAACSPQMHELTFRGACEAGGLNRYLFQMANIREQCAWVHSDREKATTKAIGLVNAAVRRVVHQKPLTPLRSPIHPDTLVVGGGIAGIQAALEIAESGNRVYLVERDSTIGGKMAKFDKTFPTLDCAACILTPKMVSVGHRKNIDLMTMSEVESVSGFIGNFKVRVRKKARYVDSKCTSCGECVKVCPVSVPNAFDELKSERTAVHKAFPQAVPNTYLIDKQQRPPCREACPIGQEAAGYIALIREGRFADAIRLIRTRNPLPVVCGRVCYHPCETECNRGYVDSPVAIQHLKRFATDWEMQHGDEVAPPQIDEWRPEKVAIIGAGPAGLTCAHDLALRGYRSTIFEKDPIAGGMLAVGIPEYRLPKRLLNSEIRFIERMGATIRTNEQLGRDFTIESLRTQGYAAVFVAIGAHKSVSLDIPGEQFEGVHSGIDFLRRVNLGMPAHVDGHVAVIGGGNTAIDAARTALRSGASKVTILYRRTRAEMPAAESEIADAEAEGVAVSYLTAPIEVVGKNGRVAGLRCVMMKLGEPDKSGRRRPMPLPGSEFTLEFDHIIVAISQMPDLSQLNGKGKLELRTSREGTLVVDTETTQTEVPWVFAGGDLVHGPSTVIAAMGAGKRAAEAIDKYLKGEPLADFKTHLVRPDVLRAETFRPHDYAPLYKDTPKRPRTTMRKLDPAVRAQTMSEVELGYTEEEARREASRCLNCGVCVECYQCVDACLPKAIHHDMKDEVAEIDVGQIIVATGYKLMDPRRMSQYGYGKFDDVYTSLEFERLLNATGPSGGKVLTRAGNVPRAVAILHCIGSRDENYNRYCSRVCCMYASKFAHLARERTHAEVYQFYIDMRAFGKGYEEFYSRVMDEGVTMIRGKAAEVVESGNGHGKYLVRCEDTLIGRFREIPVDMVVLCNAIEPAADAALVKKLFSISQSPDGFFLERHPKLDPTATTTDGVFIAGCCQGPKDIPDTVAQASAAAARVLAFISKREVEIDPVRAAIEEELCSGCRICNNLCPYQAIAFDATKKVSRIQEALCKGCGTCVAACPAGAIAGAGFTDEQIMAEIEGVLV